MVLQGCGSDQPFSVDEDQDGWPRELDCDDTDPTIFPSADDIPGDGIDQDCSGSDATGFGLGGDPYQGAAGDGPRGTGARSGTGGRSASGGAGRELGIDEDGDGFDSSVDCDDTDPNIHPGSFDIPWDGIDQDCSGADSRDRDGDGFDGGPGGPDCDDTRSEVFPGAVEIINNRIDENCDGSDLLNQLTVTADIVKNAVVASAPEIVWLDSGKELLAIWVDARRGDARDIVGQRFTVQGERVGTEITISNTDPLPKREVRLFPGAEGFLVTWITDEGGWARPLDLTGAPQGAALGIADAGSYEFRAAFGGAELDGGGTWGLIWQNPITEDGGGASFRSLTLDGIRGDILPLGGEGAQVYHATITGTDDGFLSVWDGNFEGTRGLVAAHLDRLGDPLEDLWLLRDGAVGEPTLLRHQEGYSLVFRFPENVGHVAGLFLDEHFAPTHDHPLRLSSDSSLQSAFRLCEAENAQVAVWDDGRHHLDAPAVEATYAQYFLLPGDTASSIRNWGMDRAVFAGIEGTLGAIACTPRELLVALRVGAKVGWMVQALE